VVYADAQHLKGSVKEVQVGDLLGDWNSEKLQIVEILEAAQMLQQAEQNLAEQEVKLKKQEEKVSKFKREDAGLRFTITCLVAFAVFQAGLLIWIATHRCALRSRARYAGGRRARSFSRSNAGANRPDERGTALPSA
jgi:hypothetical protein